MRGRTFGWCERFWNLVWPRMIWVVLMIDNEGGRQDKSVSKLTRWSSSLHLTDSSWGEDRWFCFPVGVKLFLTLVAARDSMSRYTSFLSRLMKSFKSTDIFREQGWTAMQFSSVVMSLYQLLLPRLKIVWKRQIILCAKDTGSPLIRWYNTRPTTSRTSQTTLDRKSFKK